MRSGQQLNERKIIRRALFHQRLTAAIVLAATLALFGLLALAASGKIDIGLVLGPCGFKQRCGLPCPTCGVTTAAIAFVRGRIFEAFYIQPAGAILCCTLVVATGLAFPIAVFGVYFGFLERFFTEVKIKHIILVLLIIIAAGWAVTLARAVSSR